MGLSPSTGGGVGAWPSGEGSSGRRGDPKVPPAGTAGAGRAGVGNVKPPLSGSKNCGLSRPFCCGGRAPFTSPGRAGAVNMGLLWILAVVAGLASTDSLRSWEAAGQLHE